MGDNSDREFLERLDAAFGDRHSVPLQEAAALLEVGRHTLSNYVKTGRITFIIKGIGRKRPRRFFTKSDLIGFMARLRTFHDAEQAAGLHLSSTPDPSGILSKNPDLRKGLRSLSITRRPSKGE